MSEPNPKLGMNHFDVTVTADLAVDHNQMFANSTCTKAIAARDARVQNVSDIDADEIARCEAARVHGRIIPQSRDPARAGAPGDPCHRE